MMSNKQMVHIVNRHSNSSKVFYKVSSIELFTGCTSQQAEADKLTHLFHMSYFLLCNWCWKIPKYSYILHLSSAVSPLCHIVWRAIADSKGLIMLVSHSWQIAHSFPSWQFCTNVSHLSRSSPVNTVCWQVEHYDIWYHVYIVMHRLVDLSHEKPVSVFRVEVYTTVVDLQGHQTNLMNLSLLCTFMGNKILIEE